MLEAIAIAIVVIGIAVYLVLFNRGRKAGKEMLDELDAAQDTAQDTGSSPEAPADTTPFASIETSNTADGMAVAHDTSVTKNMTFEDKVGGETVVVEVPSKDASRKRRVAKKAAPAVKDVAKKMKPVSTADLIRALEEKIEKRTALLKDLKLNTETDATLKRYSKMLDALSKKDTAPKKAEAKKEAKKAPVIKVKVVEEEVKPAKKSRKSTKKTTKKATKKSKKSAN